MICQPCRDGAVLVTAARKEANEDQQQAYQFLLEAEGHHKMCRGDSHCVCQHRMPALLELVQ